MIRIYFNTVKFVHSVVGIVIGYGLGDQGAGVRVQAE
jgi:hypothetical protein